MATSVKEIEIIRGQVNDNDIGQGNRSGANCDNEFCNVIGNRNRNLYGSGNIKGTLWKIRKNCNSTAPILEQRALSL